MRLNGGAEILASTILENKKFRKIKKEITQNSNLVINTTDKIHEYCDKDGYFNAQFIDKLFKSNPKEVVDKIKELGNPTNAYGKHLSSEMCVRGYHFTVDQLIALDDFSTMREIAFTYHDFSMAELHNMRNPSDENGYTLAHFMCMRDYQFSIEDIITLGNPSNNNGVTIMHIMAANGRNFSKSQIEKMGNPTTNKEFSIDDCYRYRTY